MKVHLRRKGGVLMGGQASILPRAAALFRMFVAFVLCCGLMIPSNLVTQRAWADDDFSHGKVAIASDDADDENIINLKVGETAVITISPYQHVQYTGCGMTQCPSSCEQYGDCFIEGYGCSCDKTPYLGEATVEISVTTDGIISVSSLGLADGETELTATSANLGSTNTGAITITATAEGTTELTVTTDDLPFWSDGSATYTVNVTSDDEESSEPTLNEEGYYELDSEADLQWFAEKVNAGERDINAILTDDIELASGVLPSIGGDITSSYAYTGTFDGNGFTISGITQLSAAGSSTNASRVVAMFGYLSGTVQNLTLQGDVTIEDDSLYWCSVFAYRTDGASFINCVNEVNLTAPSASGFVWSAYGGTTSFVDCTNNGNMTSTGTGSARAYNAAGFVGDTVETPGVEVTFSQCVNNGDLEIASYYASAAGFVGYKYGRFTVNIDSCVNRGNITCSSTGNLSSGRGIGGFVGSTATSATGTLSITNSYNVGDITSTATLSSTSNRGVGGIVGAGKIDTLENVFSAGTISVPEGFSNVGAITGYSASTSGSISNVYYLESICDSAVGGSTSLASEPIAISTNTLVSSDFVTTLGTDYFKEGFTHPLLTWEVYEGVAITEGQQKQLRMSSDTGSVSVTLSDVSDEWLGAVTSITVTSLGGNDKGAQTVLDASQYTISSSSITFTRTENDPVFSVAIGEGEPIDITNRWGSTITYPQSKDYKITIEAEGFFDVEGEVTFYTGSSDDFSIIIDEDGDDTTTDDQIVVYTFTQEEMAELASFQNGSSQCGMTGFRTFSGNGVSLTDLLKIAVEKTTVEGIDSVDDLIDEDDHFLIETTDQYGNDFTYEELFGTTRYFLQSVYDDDEVKATYAELVESDDEAGALIELRKLLAAKAIEDGSTVDPMIATEYVETLLSGDDVATATLPTEDDIEYNSLVSEENQYRFIYGIALVQEDCTVTFETGDGSEVESQTVKSHLMTSTANTTMWSSYWANSLIIYNDADADLEDDVSTAADTLVEPEEPTRDGYIFDGWYTKDGSEDGDWGEEFDFSANDGTVDQDTTLYAKWVEADEGEDESTVDLGLYVDMGDDGYESVHTNMGRYPAGMVQFTIRPSDEALVAYQETNPDATTRSMMADWIANITSVTIDGVALEGKAFDEWKDQLTNAIDDASSLLYYEAVGYSSYAALRLPVALFNTDHSDNQTDTKTVVIESSGFATFTDEVTYRNIGSDALVIRVLDSDGNVTSSVTLTQEDLEALDVQENYLTTANCGMAGLRSYKSEGVLLSDVLEAAGVNFESGMTLKLRVNDELATNGTADTTEDAYLSSGTFTYEDLYGTTRYYYPAMWDDTALDALGGNSIYGILSEDMDAWKGYSTTYAEYETVLKELLSETKVAVEPLIAFKWSEGVVAWDGTDPSSTEGYNEYSDQLTYRFLYGLSADEDGLIADETTTNKNSYAVFGIDIIDDSATSSEGENPVEGDSGTTGDSGAGSSSSSDSSSNDDGITSTVSDGVVDGTTDDGSAATSATSDTLAKTGDSTPVLPIVCVALGAAILAFVAFMARRGSPVRIGRHVK